MLIIRPYITGLLHWHYGNYMMVTTPVNLILKVIDIIIAWPQQKARKHDFYYSYISCWNTLDHQQWYIWKYVYLE